MKIGALRHRITIEQATDARNAIGEMVPSWATFATVWASIEPLRGRELEAAQQRFAEASHEVVIRYLVGLVPKMRVKFGTRLFDIGFVQNIEERNREMRLDVVERNL